MSYRCPESGSRGWSPGQHCEREQAGTGDIVSRDALEAQGPRKRKGKRAAEVMPEQGVHTTGGTNRDDLGLPGGPRAIVPLQEPEPCTRAPAWTLPSESVILTALGTPLDRLLGP